MNMFLKLTQVGENEHGVNNKILINTDNIVYIEESNMYGGSSIVSLKLGERNLDIVVKDKLDDIIELMKSGNRMIVEENGKMTLI